MMSRWTVQFAGSFCTAGLLLGTLFFAASLTPSLLPRTALVQGVLSGLAFGTGYLLGFWIRRLWRYLELPGLPGRLNLVVPMTAAAVCFVIAGYFLWRSVGWQNSIRAAMDLEPTAEEQHLQVALVAAAVFAGLVLLVRLLRMAFVLVSRVIRRRIPRRFAQVIGFAVVVTLLWTAANGLIFSVGLRMADSSYQQFDALIEPDVEQPLDSAMAGSAESLVDWEGMGRAGRKFIARTPDAKELDGFLEKDAAMRPARVYVGLNSAETIEARAELALEELKRIDAFERSALIIATPTGTGVVDRPAIEPVEYMTGGDVATVAVQYSYLASWLALLTESGYGADTAQVLFDRVYEYWRKLPAEERPELYLHGLSLGALNSDLSFDLFDVVADPIDGAVWSGPPFSTPTWASATQEREEGSPAWLPRFRDGSVIRFTNQQDKLDIAGAEWGPMRFVYLQYASDPIVFFEPELFYRRPAWLEGRRGPDVSQALTWYPAVTFLQLIADMPASMAAPVGYGHVYAVEHYVEAWAEVLEPSGWDDTRVSRLKARLRSLRDKN
ncbi:alpha/beta hydrolase [Fodinicurvata fenggangensis]|uniref:alpha/beta hydrolase n=1 Tax=Fodinicurvata fenggangensis TaxID=1121830 RepID=UPI000479E032|nr:alpha/beta-hydrolase family protein [Fodinicurvata fenggangensis]